MPGKILAGLAACVLVCVLSSGKAAASGWLTDPDRNCAVFAVGGGTGVTWTGDCDNGLATGLGTATFFQDGKEVESFTADFAHGMVADGHVITRWGEGWSYDGDSAHGLFNGGGVLINDHQDRYLGLWVDGKMNGFGLLDRSDGTRYAGEWKNDLPNGEGELRGADGHVISGLFTDGKLIEAKVAATPQIEPTLTPAALTSEAIIPDKQSGPFATLAGVTLKSVDGSSIALNPIEGGLEMALTTPGGDPQKTTFTFMTDRLGTIVEDGGPNHGANVTGFFRLTETGVEMHYADDRAETISATPDGGVIMVLTGAHTSCRSWYPDGHVFSEAEKKEALAEYAVRLGLAANTAEGQNCAAPMPVKAITPQDAPQPRPASSLEHRPSVKTKAVKTAYVPAQKSSPNVIATLTPVIVKDSQVHAIDGEVLPSATESPVATTSNVNTADPSKCLRVDSDGLNWGFRNACDFPLQFAYCVPSDKGLTACANGGAPGSVAARGFGALMADKSLSETGVDHSFRWIACAGGAGEVLAHLDHADPPSGRCERAAATVAAK